MFKKSSFNSILKSLEKVSAGHNCRTTKKWLEKAKQLNFLLLAHEYLFVFQK